LGFKSVYSKGVVPVEDKGNNNIREPHVDVGHLHIMKLALKLCRNNCTSQVLNYQHGIQTTYSLSVKLSVELVKPAKAGLVPAGEAVVEVYHSVVLLHVLVQCQENVPDDAYMLYKINTALSVMHSRCTAGVTMTSRH